MYKNLWKKKGGNVRVGLLQRISHPTTVLRRTKINRTENFFFFFDYVYAKAWNIQRKRGLSYLFSELTSAAECTLEVQGTTEDNIELYLEAKQE